MGAPPSGLTIGKSAAKTSRIPSMIWRSSAVMARSRHLRSGAPRARQHDQPLGQPLFTECGPLLRVDAVAAQDAQRLLCVEGQVAVMLVASPPVLADPAEHGDLAIEAARSRMGKPRHDRPV